jgi:hypothetical protein
MSIKKLWMPPLRIKDLSDRSWLLWFNRIVELNRFEKVVYEGVGATLTTDDFGKNLVFNTGGVDIEVYLPSIDNTDIGGWIRILKTGTGEIKIWAASGQVIENSVEGGYIWGREPVRSTNVVLEVASSNQWLITGATGRWDVVRAYGTA